MSETSNNLAMEQSFRAVAQAIDQLPQEQTTDFLARLVLVLAHELQDANRFAQAVERARAPLVQEASA
jgi:hypothetical protein